MKNIIVGTAGHIDHGKTTLIKALTGRNTDRWEEEQRRGITIDLGFTYFDLKNGDRVGIIDVPGHEKFINNMVAGVVGMDLVLLVCGKVSWQTKDIMRRDRGQGLSKLVNMIQKMTENEVTEKDIHTIPVFRSTVYLRCPVLGRLSREPFWRGLSAGKILCVCTRTEKNVRSAAFRFTGRVVDVCYAGQRVAINLSNVKKKEIHRGCVLAPPTEYEKYGSAGCTSECTAILYADFGE